MQGKSRTRTWLLIVLAVLLLVASACSGGSNSGSGGSGGTTTGTTSSGGTGGGSGSGSGGGSGGTATEEKWEDIYYPVTFSMNSVVPNLTWDTTVGRELQKRTNVTMQWENISEGEKEKMQLWLAGGDYPDFVWMNDAYFNDYKKAGALIELTDLIMEYAPDIVEAFNGDLRTMQDENGEIYALRAPPVQEIRPVGSTRGFISIQAHVLEEAGWPPINSLEDVYRVVKEYIQKYPTINGGKTLGFSQYGHDNEYLNVYDLTSTNALAGGVPYWGIWAIDGDNVRIKYFEDGQSEWHKFLARMNAEGLFDEEALIQNVEQATEKCSQGRVLVFFGWGPPCNPYNLDMPERQYISFDFVLEGKTRYRIVDLNAKDRWVGITKNVKDPVRAIRFFNQMYQLENQILLGWGLEGVHYTVENGRKVMIPEMYAILTNWDNDTEGVASYARYMMLPWASGSILRDGDWHRISVSPEWIAAGYNDQIKSYLAHYGATVQGDLLVDSVAVNIPTGVIVKPEDITDFEKEVIAKFKEYSPQMILSKDPNRVDALWAQFLSDLDRLGVNQMNQRMTQVFNEQLERMGFK
jgi:putative aldouronate transport system substrate-binding protein